MLCLPSKQAKIKYDFYSIILTPDDQFQMNSTSVKKKKNIMFSGCNTKEVSCSTSVSRSTYTELYTNSTFVRVIADEEIIYVYST